MQMSSAAGGSRSGLGFVGWLLIFLVLLLLVLAFAHSSLSIPQQAVQATGTPSLQCPTQTQEGTPVFIVNLSRSKYPQATNHIDMAREKGKPYLLTLDRPGATKRRQAALAGWPTKSGFARDEYPPAIALEGGTGADIMYIDPSDNSGAGAVVGNTLNGPPKQPDGTKFCIQLVR